MSVHRDAGHLIPSERIEGAILVIRGRKVMLSRDLAALYGVSAKVFNQAVKRNADRFQPDFMFQLTWEEAEALRSQSVTSGDTGSRSQIVTLGDPASRSQNATLKRGSNIKYRPLAFTEHGAVMAASVLNSPRAVEVSVFVVRAFVRLSRIAADQRQLALRLAVLFLHGRSQLESRVTVHDKALQAVIAQLKQLIQLPAPEPKKRRIGFGRDDNRTGSISDFVVRDKPARKHRGRKVAGSDER